MVSVSSGKLTGNLKTSPELQPIDPAEYSAISLSAAGGNEGGEIAPDPDAPASAPLQAPSPGSAPIAEDGETQNSEQSSLLHQSENENPVQKHQHTAARESPGVPPSPTAWRRIRRYWRARWASEFCSCVLAALSLMALFITLMMHQGKPLPQWPLSITINALVAVFTALIRAGVALPISEGISQLKWRWFRHTRRPLEDMEEYDEAGRGPMGAAKFIFKMDTEDELARAGFFSRLWGFVSSLFQWKRGNIPAYLTKLASLVAILAVIADPFAQQLVQYQNCFPIDPNGLSSLPRTEFYNGTENGIDTDMVVTINTGLSNPPKNIASLLPAHCESGNCTFGLVSTVGVCHSCRDISDQIHNGTFPGQRLLNVTGLYPNVPASNSSNDFAITTTLTPFITIAGLPGSFYDKHLVEMVAFGGPAGLPEDVHTASATRCSISPCLRTYNSTMANSTLTEVLLSTAILPAKYPGGIGPMYGGHYDTFRLATNRTTINGQWSDCTRRSDNASGFIQVSAQNIQDNSTLGGEDSLYFPSDCVWRFGFDVAANIGWELLNQLHNQNITYINQFGPTSSGSVVARRLWLNGTGNFESTNQYMSDLAETITTAIRQFGDGGESEWAKGRVQARMTCAVVYWRWMSFLVVLVFLSFVFFGLVLIHSPKDEVLWKSSSLAVLFCILDENIAQNTRADQTRDNIYQVAKEKAQLLETSEGRAIFR